MLLRTFALRTQFAAAGAFTRSWWSLRPLLLSAAQRLHTRAPATAPPSRDDTVSALDVAGVSAWLRARGVPARAVAALAAAEVDGASLLRASSAADLVSWGVAAGPASLVWAITVAARVAQSALPPPLEFQRETVGGQPMMVASLVGADGSGSVPRPFFLTLQEHADLLRAAHARAAADPLMTLLTGAVKSGKTSLLAHVLPGMIAAQYAAAAESRQRRPVILQYQFPQHLPAAPAALHLLRALAVFAQAVGVPLPVAAATSALSEGTAAIDLFPFAVRQLAHAIHDAGGELWLMIDELQAPLIASTPDDAQRFAEQLKKMVEACVGKARVVGAGSGMATLLAALRDTAPNGFIMWEVVERIALGREPPAPVALAMAERIVSAYATQWSEALASYVTPSRVVASLAHDATAGYTSPRPALVAFLASLVSARASARPEAALARALKSVLLKLEKESKLDCAIALTRTSAQDAKWLRDLADPGSTSAQLLAVRRELEERDLSGWATVDLADQLCEEGGLRLLPPYGAWLCQLVTREGFVMVAVEASRLVLAPAIDKNLTFIKEYTSSGVGTSHALRADTRAAISAAVLDVLARKGVLQRGSDGVVLLPRTFADVHSVPAFAEILRVLNTQNARRGNLSESQTVVKLAQAAAAPEKQSSYIAELGLHVLHWLRNVHVHVWFSTTELQQKGLTSTTVTLAVSVATGAILDKEPERIKLGVDGVLAYVEICGSLRAAATTSNSAASLGHVAPQLPREC